MNEPKEPGVGQEDSVEGSSGDSAAEGEVQGVVVGCQGATFPELPRDATFTGPFAVGARTVSVAGLTTEIWYPANPLAARGRVFATYDLREHLPVADQSKIPDEANPLQSCACYRELPLDPDFGPYPLVLFIHGTAGFRSQTLAQMVHWASRGFVVVASDHPGMHLRDVLVFNFDNQQATQASLVLDALASLAPADDAGFLVGRIDLTRVAVAGHSAGGMAAAEFSSRAGVRALIPMAAGGVESGTEDVSTLVLAGTDDGIVPYDTTVEGYDASPPPRRLIGLDKAGHLAFSDICSLTSTSGGLLDVALRYGVEINPLILELAQDGCQADQLSSERGWTIINDATSLLLEERLLCRTDAAEELRTIEARYPEVFEYREDL